VDELLLVDVAVAVLVQDLEEALVQDARQVRVLQAVSQTDLWAYLREDYLVDALALLVALGSEVTVDVLEVRDKHEFDEVLVLFQVEVLKENLISLFAFALYWNLD
jgi:hypothetical protein